MVARCLTCLIGRGLQKYYFVALFKCFLVLFSHKKRGGVITAPLIHMSLFYLFVGFNIPAAGFGQQILDPAHQSVGIGEIALKE